MAGQKSLKEKLEENRIILICGPITSEVASDVILQLLTMSAKDEKADIHLYIGAFGTEYLDSLAIYDTMRSLPNDITGTCVGMATNYAALILAACKKGKRYALKHARITIEQPKGYLAGRNQQTEIAIEAKEVTTKRKIFEELMAEATGQELSRIHEDCEVGRTFTAEEAKEYGIIDVILDKGE